MSQANGIRGLTGWLGDAPEAPAGHPFCLYVDTDCRLPQAEQREPEGQRPV